MKDRVGFCGRCKRYIIIGSKKVIVVAGKRIIVGVCDDCGKIIIKIK